jgi:hypothetical protein
MKSHSFCAAFYISVTIIFLSFTVRETIIDPDKISFSDADSTGWHPETFYIVYPDLKMTFDLPYEDDRSGVANLLFIDKNTGGVRLLDTVVNERYIRNRIYIDDVVRKYRRLSGTYDVILLYNNGKYIRQKDVFWGKDISTEVNMKHLKVQPCDSLSLHWLTLRAFTSAISDRVFDHKRAVSEKKIRGYLFVEGGPATQYAVAGIAREITGEGLPSCTSDGYFEVDVDDENYLPLEFHGIGQSRNFERFDAKANSGIFYVMTGPSPEEIRNVIISH